MMGLLGKLGKVFLGICIAIVVFYLLVLVTAWI